MKKDERFIKKALLSLREGEQPEGFPDRTEENKRLVNQNYRPRAARRAMPGLRRWAAAAMALVVLIGAGAIISTLTGGGEDYLVNPKRRIMNYSEISSEFIGFNVPNTLVDGKFKVANLVDVYVDAGEPNHVIYSQITYNMELPVVTEEESRLEFTLVSFKSNLKWVVIEDKPFYYNLLKSGTTAGGIKYTYSPSNEKEIYSYASIEIGESTIWLKAECSEELLIAAIEEVADLQLAD